MLSEKYYPFIYTAHIIPKKIDRTNCSSFHFVRAPQSPSLKIGHNRFEQERCSSWNIVLQYVWKIFQLQYNCRSFMKAGLSLFVLRSFAVCYVNNMFVKILKYIEFLNRSLLTTPDTRDTNIHLRDIKTSPYKLAKNYPSQRLHWVALSHRCYHQLLLLFRFVRDKS